MDLKMPRIFDWSVEKTIIWLFFFGPFAVTAIFQEWKISATYTVFVSYLLVICACRRGFLIVRDAMLLWVGASCFLLWLLVQILATDIPPLAALASIIILFSTLLFIAVLAILNIDGRLDRTVYSVLFAVELLLVVNVLVSFFWGIGEYYSYRGGGARAFGLLSDSVSPIVGFFVLKNAIENKKSMTLLLSFVLAATGGKMALGITIVGFVILALLGRGFRKTVYLGFVAIVLSQIMLHASFELELSPNKFVSSSMEPPSLLQSFSSFVIPNAEAKQTVSEVVTDTIQSGSRRVLSLAAGIEIARTNPFFGVGYRQSADQISNIATIDPFGVGDLLEAPKVGWEQIKGVQNASLRVAAETGFVGLVFFWVFCFGMLIVFIKSLMAQQRSAFNNLDSVKVAASVWGISLILFNQTVAWMEPAHLQLIWLSLCVSIVTVSTKPKFIKSSLRGHI